MSERHFPGKIIDIDETRLWTQGQFVHMPDKSYPNHVSVKPIIVESGSVNRSYWVDQHSPFNFKEFDDEAINRETGYGSRDLRADACGITSLHIVLGSLSTSYKRFNPTVGKLAKYALSLHRNDLTEEENLLKKGTPVFNSKSGWYHDALLFVAGQFDVKGYRFEETSLEQVGSEVEKLKKDKKEALAIISVEVNYRNGNIDGGTSHMVVVSGFKFNRLGKVKAIRVTDPSASTSNGSPLEEWVKIDDRVKKSFKNKAMFFYV